MSLDSQGGFKITWKTADHIIPDHIRININRRYIPHLDLRSTFLEMQTLNLQVPAIIFRNSWQSLLLVVVL